LFSPYADALGLRFTGERFNPLHTVLMNAARHFVAAIFGNHCDRMPHRVRLFTLSANLRLFDAP
jgi:hypothetical protein